MRNRIVSASALLGVLAAPLWPSAPAAGQATPPAPSPPTAPAPATPAPPNPAPAAPTPATPPPPSPAPTLAPTPDVNAAARDARTLHPLLIPTDAAIQDSLDAGRAFGKTSKDFIDLLGDDRHAFASRPGGMLGEKRRDVGVAVWMTPNLAGRWYGFLEQRLFASNETRQTDFQTLRDMVTAPRRTLRFLVEISDLVPSEKDKKKGDAAPADPAARVAGTRLVLSDDRDHNYDPVGGSPAPRLMPRQQFYDVIAPDPKDTLAGIAPAADAKPPADASRLVKRRPPYSDLGAFFLVSFDAFNPDGTARIGRDTRRITLHVIGPDGDRAATFDLDKTP